MAANPFPDAPLSAETLAGIRNRADASRGSRNPYTPFRTDDILALLAEVERGRATLAKITEFAEILDDSDYYTLRRIIPLPDRSDDKGFDGDDLHEAPGSDGAL